MILREEVEPKVKIARALYPEILRLILEYTDYCDKNGDEDGIGYKNLECRLHQLTGKDMSDFNLWEWWEEEGAETLAYRIALPQSAKVKNITRVELAEIVSRLRHDSDSTAEEGHQVFDNHFAHCLHEYYFNFLKINFSNYKHEFFNRQKDERGKYFELSTDDIVNKIWNM